MTTPMISKALDIENKVSANMKKASAILNAMRTLHSEECMMSDEVTADLIWAASDLIDDAIEADAEFTKEQIENDLYVRYQQVPGANHQIKAVK